MNALKVLLLTAGLLAGVDALAAGEGLTLLQTAPVAGGQSYSIPADSLPFVLLLPFLPALILSLSAFTRVAVVFFLLRQGLGNQYAPPNLVLLGLALLLTWFVMQPVVQKMHSEAFEPYSRGSLPPRPRAKRRPTPSRASCSGRRVPTISPSSCPKAVKST